MTIREITKKEINLVNTIEKGSIRMGTIVEIVDGLAEDFMTVEQLVRYQGDPSEPLTRIEIHVEGFRVTKTIRDYTRIGDGSVPYNSPLGKIATICKIKENAIIPMVVEDIVGESIVWDVAI